MLREDVVREVLARLARGEHVKTIARALGVDKKTIRSRTPHLEAGRVRSGRARGLVGAAAATQLVRHMRFGPQPLDLLTLTRAALILLAASGHGWPRPPPGSSRSRGPPSLGVVRLSFSSGQPARGFAPRFGRSPRGPLPFSYIVVK